MGPGPQCLRREYALAAAARYWPKAHELLVRLPVPQVERDEPEQSPPRLLRVNLPQWGRDVGVDGQLLLPEGAVRPGDGPAWQRVDWWGAIFWYLNGCSERAFEARNGPIHSYSFRLRGWDPWLWRHAWVNRSALFLRRWAARHAGVEEHAAFGDLPRAEVILTHDVDAIRKTVAIRIKQSAFRGLNAARLLASGRIARSIERAAAAFSFLVRSGQYSSFERIMALEEARGLRSHFNVYGGPGGWSRTPRQLLFDPAYRADNPELARLLRALRARGWTVGLHQSFGAWHDAAVMAEERKRLEKVLGAPVTSCRQHWLRFSWERTWHAQQQAGFALDTTLGFNDRPGFRSGVALRYRPWDPAGARPLELETMPLVLMDSHLYDYGEFSAEERRLETAHFLGEIEAVRGTATVLWHSQTLSRDYGWEQGFRELLAHL